MLRNKKAKLSCRGLFCWTTLAGLFLILCDPGIAQEDSQAEHQAKPNVVVILADDMGFGDVANLNPDSKIPTPNLDSLANQGLTLLDAHTPSAVCTPTRYGLLTGRYCWRTRLEKGVLGGYSQPLLEEGRLTIANRFQQAGYQTGAVGKWHLGMELPTLDPEKTNRSTWKGDPGIDFQGEITNSPIHHGFDQYFGVTASLDMPPYVYVENDRFASQPSLQQPAVGFPHFIRQGPRSEDFVVDEVLDRLTDRACSFIVSSQKEDRPFFLYMPLTGPHKPTQPHERFRGDTGLGEYGDFVKQVDWTVGQVLQTLEDVGVAENTIVIFTSDNGSYMFRQAEGSAKDHVDDETIQAFFVSRHQANGIFRGTKADIYEAGHRVPFFVRWPGKVEPGTKSRVSICLTDIYATMVEVLGEELGDSEGEDSWSFLSVLQGGSKSRPKPIIHHSVNGTFAIRLGAWKLIASNGSGGREKPAGRPFERPYQLYRLDTDPGETENLIAEYPDEAKTLERELEAIRSAGRTFTR